MSYREKIDKLLVRHSVSVTDLKTTIEKMEALDAEIILHDEAKVVIQKSSQITQRNLEEHISSLVTKALDIVFLEDSKEFVCQFVTRRNVIECDLMFRECGRLIHPLDSSGFGEADIASFALRVAYWALGTSRNTLVVDEPFRNLDSDRMERASEMMKFLSDELKLQMILVTHEEAVKDSCDRRFHVTRRDKKSSIRKI